MPSTNRRRLLAALGAAGAAGLAGCTALGGGRPDVNTGSGLVDDTSRAFDDEALYLAGDATDLPDPPRTVDAVEDADAVLATSDASLVAPTRALRDGTPVAFAGGGAQGALQRLLDAAAGDRTFGVESVRARPVETTVAVPGHSGAVDTYTFVAEGGWDDPVLDPFGWALAGRVPACDTFVPESSMDDRFEYAGAAHVVGRLPTGEAYASRSEASVARQDAGTLVRLRTRLHADADDGYAVRQATREADLPDDQHLHSVFPNPHTRNGVQVANVSDTARSTFAVEVTPASDRARSALTGCGGLRTADRLAYDHRTSFEWRHDGVIDADSHYGGGTGRGEWSLSGGA